jgi:hypothetical protein
MNLKEKTVCIYDDGLFMFLAERLARDFKVCYLFTPWKSDYPRAQDDAIGEGIKGVKRISDFWDYIDEIDLFVFPGLYQGDIQNHLVDLGKRVWGSKNGDCLERYRLEANERFKKLGMPRPEMESVTGIGELRERLQDVDNRYIKVSNYRKDFETWKHENYKLSEPILDELEHRLGKNKDKYEFIIETPISGEDVVEFGYDGFCIDGQFPSKTIIGYEIKDVAYCCHVKKHEDLSPLITDFTDKISSTLKKFRYRNFFHTEGRTGKEKIPRVIDVTCRAGSPPSEVLVEMISNLDEVMWYGADGELIEPVFEAKYGIEIMIDSSWAGESRWQAIDYPKEISRWVKLRSYTIIDGMHYVIPKYQDFDNCGAVVAIGDTMQECFDKVKKYAGQIKGHKIDINCGSIDKLNEVIKRGEVIGIKFN